MDDTTDQRAHETGSVADEAMKLMESLGMWAASAQQPKAAGSQETASPNGYPASSDQAPADSASAASTADGCSCAGTGSAEGIHQPAVCKVCPVCRVGSLLESLSPEVMERFADLIAMVAGSLQAAAQHRRSETPSSSPAPAPTPTRKVRVTGDAPDEEHAADGHGSAE